MRGIFINKCKKALVTVMTGAIALTTIFATGVTTFAADETVKCDVTITDKAGVKYSASGLDEALNSIDGDGYTITIADEVPLTYDYTVNRAVTIIGSFKGDGKLVAGVTEDGKKLCMNADTAGTYKFAEHKWNEDKTTFGWADDLSSVVVTLVCDNGDTKSETIGSAYIDASASTATCDKAGKLTSTIKTGVTVDSVDVGGVSISKDAAALGHKYELTETDKDGKITKDLNASNKNGSVTLEFSTLNGEYGKDDNGYPVITGATMTCLNAVHTNVAGDDKATAVVTGSSVVKAATSAAKGTTAYTIDVTGADGTVLTVVKKIDDIPMTEDYTQGKPVGVQFKYTDKKDSTVKWSDTLALGSDIYAGADQTDGTVTFRVVYEALDANDNVVAEKSIFGEEKTLAAKAANGTTILPVTSCAGGTYVYNGYSEFYKTKKSNTEYQIIKANASLDVDGDGKHVLDESKAYTIVKEAGCAGGTANGTCKICGKSSDIIGVIALPAVKAHTAITNNNIIVTYYSVGIKSNETGFVEDTTAPTEHCEKDLYTYNKCKDCDEYFNETVEAATGHDLYASATNADWTGTDKDKAVCVIPYTCYNCKKPITITYTSEKAPKGQTDTQTMKYAAIDKTVKTVDCTEYDVVTWTVNGVTDVKGNTFTKEIETKIPGAHNYATSFAWAANLQSATLTLECQNKKEKTEAAADHLISKACAVEAKDNADGTTTYTASVTYDGQTYTDSKTIIDLTRAKVTINDGLKVYVGQNVKAVVKVGDAVISSDLYDTDVKTFAAATTTVNITPKSKDASGKSLEDVILQNSSNKGNVTVEAAPVLTTTVNKNGKADNNTTFDYKKDQLISVITKSDKEDATVKYYVADEDIAASKLTSDLFTSDKVELTDAGEYHVYAMVVKEGYTDYIKTTDVKEITINPLSLDIEISINRNNLKYGEVPEVTVTSDQLTNSGIDTEQLAADIADKIGTLNVGSYPFKSVALGIIKAAVGDNFDVSKATITFNGSDISSNDASIEIKERSAIVRIDNITAEEGDTLDFANAYSVTGLADKDAEAENPLAIEIICTDSTVVDGEAAIAGEYTLTAVSINTNYDVKVIDGKLTVKAAEEKPGTEPGTEPGEEPGEEPGTEPEVLNGFVKVGNAYFYYVDGEIAAVNDIVYDAVDGENAWWHIVDGKLDYTTTVAPNKNGWWYVKNGKVDFTFNGFADNENGRWKIENGKVTFNYNDVVYESGQWRYYWGSKFLNTYTGVANCANSNGWWYVKNGVVDFTADTIAMNSNGWWKVTGGKVDFSSNTVAMNEYGWWVVENGKVTFNYNGLATNQNGTWYCVGSKVIFSFNGTYVSNGTSYEIVNGKVVK